MDAWQLRAVLPVRDIARAVRFYHDLLGLRLMDRWEQGASAGAIFDTGRGQIQVYRGPDGADEPTLNPPTLMLLTADVDRECGRLLTMGVRPLWGPATSAWGTRQFAIQDPDGTMLVLCSPVTSESPAGDTAPAPGRA